MPEPIATWNPTRDVWETDRLSLFSERPDVFSETWPTSGMTRRGELLPLPTSVPAIDADACSSSPLLPTPITKYSGLTVEQFMRFRKIPPGGTISDLRILFELVLRPDDQ